MQEHVVDVVYWSLAINNLFYLLNCKVGLPRQHQQVFYALKCKVELTIFIDVKDGELEATGHVLTQVLANIVAMKESLLSAIKVENLLFFVRNFDIVCSFVTEIIGLYNLRTRTLYEVKEVFEAEG